MHRLYDALEKLKPPEEELYEGENYGTIQRAAGRFQAMQREMQQKQSIDIYFEAASKIVPDSFFNFTAMLLCDKTPELQDSGRVLVDQQITDCSHYITATISNTAERVARTVGADCSRDLHFNPQYCNFIH